MDLSITPSGNQAKSLDQSIESVGLLEEATVIPKSEINGSHTFPRHVYAEILGTFNCIMRAQ